MSRLHESTLAICPSARYTAAVDTVAQPATIASEDAQPASVYDYHLPPERIAQRPSVARGGSRLMVLDRAGAGSPLDHQVSELSALVRGDELIVMNDTRVVKARLRGHKPTGGAVELLVLHPVPGQPDQAVAMGRSSKPLRVGTPITLGSGETVVLEEVLGGGHYRVRPPSGADLWAFLDAHGEVPLPPYINRTEAPDGEDEDRYQTIYAREEGSVAAPTAGLHFTSDALEALKGRGCQVAFVTLHVGPGTFTPIRATDLREHRMHSERYSISEQTAAALDAARSEGRPVLAVGTTTVRALEGSAAAHGQPVAETAETSLFLRPGASFRVVDQLMTNFHLPGSSLLVLVSAFAGVERVQRAYEEAIRRSYRFYSYGDAMWIR